MPSPQRGHNDSHLLHRQVQAFRNLLTGVKGRLRRQVHRQKTFLKKPESGVRLKVGGIYGDRLKMARYNMAALRPGLVYISDLVNDMFADIPALMNRRRSLLQGLGD